MPVAGTLPPLLSVSAGGAIRSGALGPYYERRPIDWRDLPLALYPDTERDCFSGQALVERDRVVAMYHGTLAGNAIATASDPLLLNWKKHPNNPVILGDVENIGGANIAPVEADGAQYRVFDPCIWREDDGYYALSGTFKDGVRGVDCVGVDHLFRSPDLAAWEYLGPLMEDRFLAEPGEDAAVPNFWPIGNGMHMLLLFSQNALDATTSATMIKIPIVSAQNTRPDELWSLDGGSLHAPSATIDDSGRYLAIFNIKEGREPRGWSDIMTLPRHYSLDAENSLLMEPAGDIESLRFDHRHVDASEIAANSETVLRRFVERQWRSTPSSIRAGAREVGLYVFRSPHGEEKTRVSLLSESQIFRCQFAPDRRIRFFFNSNVFARTPETGPLKLGENCCTFGCSLIAAC